MRIVHVVSEAANAGNGIVNATVDLACTQSLAGHQVSFVSSGGEYVDLLAHHRVEHFAVNLRPQAALKLVRDVPLLKRIINSVQPDIVHAHMIAGAVLMSLGRAAAGFGNYGLVTTIHNEWRKASWLMRLGDGVIVLSNRGRKKFIERGFPEHKLRVVPHGVLGSPRRANECEGGEAHQQQQNVAPTIVTMGGLYVRKGIGDLIQAFDQIAEEFPDASLLVLGSGPARALFEKQKNSVKGRDRVHFQGFVARPRAIMRQAAVFVLASHTESFSLSIAEAREAGCAIVATAVGGVPELLEHGRAGLLVPPHDAGTLAQTLRYLLRNPRELAHWREAAHANLGWLSCTRMEKETMDVYFSVLRQRGVPKQPD